MASSQPPPGKPKPWADGAIAVYHITHVDNLPGLAEDCVIHCDKGCAAAGRKPVSIGYSDLKEKRARTVVTVAAGGTLADYVPFYYAPRSPMLYVNWRGGVAGYDGGQENIVHLVCGLQDLAITGEFVITDGHPISPLSTQHEAVDALDQIDWDVMRRTYWADDDTDGDRKRRRQAEFLVHQQVPVSAIRLVAAMNNEVAARALKALVVLAEPPPVRIRPDWYY